MSLNKENKPWYKSKTVWAGVIIISVNVWDNMLVPSVLHYLHFSLPNIPIWVYSTLAGLGIYGRISAKTSIGK